MTYKLAEAVFILQQKKGLYQVSSICCLLSAIAIQLTKVSFLCEKNFPQVV